MRSSTPIDQQAPDVDRGSIISTCLWVFSATSVLLQAGRLWSRVRVGKLGWDDYWMFFTAFLLVAFTIVIQIAVNHGGGRHFYHIVATEGAGRAQYLAKLSWISQPFGIMALGTGKISVGILIIRFLYSQKRWFRYSIWVCIITVNANFIAAILLTFFQCNPPRKLWNTDLPGKCLDPKVQTEFSVYGSLYGAAADVFLALLPLAVIVPLQMRLRKKIGLCVIFGLGVLAGACGFYKATRIPGLGVRGDVTWNSYEALLFTGAETWLVIICGTVPTIAPLWELSMGRMRTLSNLYSLSKISLPKRSTNESDDTVELRDVRRDVATAPLDYQSNAGNRGKTDGIRV